MNTEIREWVAKAEGDYFSALRERRAKKHVNHDAACFHAQQCMEKYLKAVLVSHNIRFAKVHDLFPLIVQCLPYYPDWIKWRDDMEWLSQFAVLFRYPGESANCDDAQKAITIVRLHRQKIRLEVGLK